MTVKNAIEVNGHDIFIDNELWKHTLMRINNAEIEARKKAEKYMSNPKWIKKNGETNFNIEFLKLMVGRLKKITNVEKIYYAIAVLNKKGYSDIVDVYEGRLLMEHMIKSYGQL